MTPVYAIPIAPDCIDKGSECLASWKRMGYETAALIYGDRRPENCDHVLRVPSYSGWPWSVNRLSEFLSAAEWIVTGGADITPDPNHPAVEIAAQCVEHFHGTFGVLQPSGDAYGALADKSACVSPWIGRDFCRRAYGGRGPLNEDYFHFWADTELREVSAKLGCLWWRDDLIQFHDHWTRHGVSQPDHLTRAEGHAIEDAKLFKARKPLGFPGH